MIDNADSEVRFQVGDRVVVRGHRIGEYDFIGQVLVVDGPDPECGHVLYDVANYLTGEVVICCGHLLEQLGPGPVDIAIVHRVEHVSPFVH